MDPTRAPRPAPRWLLALRLLLVLWAGFWGWFVVAVSVGEKPAPPLWIPLSWLGSLGVLILLCWRWPRIGGTGLVAAALWAGWYFADPGARLILAAPAFALGLGFLLAGSGVRARRSAVSGAWLGLLLLLGACHAPQVASDLPYRTSSILWHENGTRKRAQLLETTELGGLPCRSWVWWHADGSLDSVELAADAVVQGHAFPAGTRVFLDEQGRLAHAWLARTTEIDGLPCRGRWKIDTAFHPDGTIRAFFPPEDLQLDGVWCEASVFHPVYLHPGGRLAQCRLARPAYLHGRRFERGVTLRLDERGHPRE